MKFCTHCGKQLMDEAVICPGCGCPTTNQFQTVQPTAAQYQNGDTVSGGLCVLSALIPLFGIVYWIANYRETPRKAKACGVTAIVAWVVSFVISMVIYMIIYSDLLDMMF